MNLAFEELTEEDIPVIAQVMARAFNHDAQRHLGIDKGGPDGYDDGRFFKKWVFSFKESRGYKILLDTRVIGGFVIWLYNRRPNVLGTIFVDPDYQDRGVGTRAWSFIEATYPSREGWRLETPSYALKNLYFYEHKCGFHKIRARTTTEHRGMSVIYEKKPPTSLISAPMDELQ